MKTSYPEAIGRFRLKPGLAVIEVDNPWPTLSNAHILVMALRYGLCLSPKEIASALFEKEEKAEGVVRSMVGFAKKPILATTDSSDPIIKELVESVQENQNLNLEISLEDSKRWILLLEDCGISFRELGLSKKRILDSASKRKSKKHHEPRKLSSKKWGPY